MTLRAGTRIGPYEVVSIVGAGGMGEVYKARDARLNRCVAVKLLHPEFAERADRRARFETEARAIAALNHPHICTLFDIGVHDDRSFLVMELLEGETLDDRLTRGPLPPVDVLRFGAAIADALAHAHDARIVHRDVKPSNVMITATGAKLLDFGLARTLPSAGLLLSPAASIPSSTLTAEGTLVGTFQYMAPEQLHGREVDARTDIFALGMLLYEMATGRKAFSGTSQANLIAEILTGQPPLISSTSTAGNSPLLALDRIVERCLRKNPDERWQSAREIKVELDGITRTGTSAQLSPARRITTRRREALAWTLALIAAVVATVLGFRAPNDDIPRHLTRFIVAPPTGTTISVAENRTRIAISPDGRRLALVASTGGREQIWLRSLDSIAAKPLAGTEGGDSPFWSPDSRFIGFFSSADGQLKKVETTGGPARIICAAEMEGAPVWGRDGTILFTQRDRGVYRVPADGGVPVQVTTVDKSKRELNHFWPQFLPDGRRFLYMATSLDAAGARETPSVYVASLDSSPPTLLTRVPSRMVYAQGYLLFVHEATLLAQPFDAATLQLSGEPTRIADGVAYTATLGNGGFTLSDNEVLAVQGSGDQYSMIWYDRGGNTTVPSWSQQTFGSVRLAPDGRQVAVDVTDPRTGTADVWIYDAARGTPVRLTTDLANDSQAVWSPDGKRLLFRSERRGAPSLYEKTIGTGSETLLASESIPLTPEDWSLDGNWIAYVRQTRQSSWDLWLMPVTGDRKPFPFSMTRFAEWGARFSPDSRWIAYTSTESGSPEVYVASLSEPGNRHRISVDGGTTPRWRRDGRELYYASADSRSIFAVPIEAGPTFKPGTPTRLLSIGAVPAMRDRARNVVYDVTPDGQRFLVTVPAGELASSRITVVLNWMAALRP